MTARLYLPAPRRRRQGGSGFTTCASAGRAGIECTPGRPRIPLFIDSHDVTGATPDAIADANLKDVAVQGRYGVRYVKYWMNEARGKVFCLCTAPDAETANRVHREAHGLVAERIIEVDPDLAEGMLGGGAVAATGAALAPGGTLDPGVRTLLFTDIVGSTELTQRLGDRAGLDIVDLHDRVVRDALERAGEPLRIHVGIAAGEPIERNGDFFGSTVQLAARRCMQAARGQTLVSSSVAELCRRRRLTDIGELALKGFPHGVRVHAVAEE